MTDKELRDIKAGIKVVVVFKSHRARDNYCPKYAKAYYSMYSNYQIHLLKSHDALDLKQANHKGVWFPKNLDISKFIPCIQFGVI